MPFFSNCRVQLQVIMAGGKFHLFRSWGRVGTDQGGRLVTAMPKSDAVDQFRSLFFDKTANVFGDVPYEKQPGKFCVIEIDYGVDDPAALTAQTSA
jgi:predicted DNA-binding WGR domain protein